MRSEFQSFMLGAAAMLVACAVVVRTGAEFKIHREVKVLKEQCEQNLPRNENCVIVAIPKSKD